MNSLFKTVTCTPNSDDVIAFEQKHKIEKQQIFIEDLTLNMFIGVFEEEKKQKQRVIVNATLDVEPSQNWQADNIDDVVSYADIVDMIRDIAGGDEHIELVETFAHLIADECLKINQVTSVDLKISKPDVLKGVNSIGMRLRKSR